MSYTKQELINKIKELKKSNDEFTYNITDLAGTENSRAEIMSSIYIRKNKELRLKNMSDIDNEFVTQGKIFNQSPEKYTVSQVSIKRSYIEQINRFMREYNSRYTTIQTEIHKAQESQKILMFKSCKYSNSKKIYMLSADYQNFLIQKQQMIAQYRKDNNIELYKKIEDMKDPCFEYDEKIAKCKRQIKLYENIISRCDKEFENCTKRREEHFNKLFGEEYSIALKPSGYKAIVNMIMNKLDGANRFSKLVVKKHASRINDLKIRKMDEYADKIKQETVDFSREIEDMINDYGE